MKFRLKTVNPWGMMLIGVPVFGGSLVLIFLGYAEFVPLQIQETIQPYFIVVILIIIWPVIWLLKRSFRLAASESEYEFSDLGLHVRTIPKINFMGSRDRMISWESIRSMKNLTDANGSWLVLHIQPGPDLRIVYRESADDTPNFEALHRALQDRLERNNP